MTQSETLDTRCWRLVSALQVGEIFVSDHPPRPGQNNMDDGEPGSRSWVAGCLFDVFGGTVREHKFVATPHAPVPRLVSFPGRPHGECALHQLANLPSLPFRLSAVPRASSTPPLAPSSLHCAYLPVWPATRLLCPPPRSVLSGMGFWDVGGFAVESVAARVCCEAGARVSVNVRVQDMDLALPDALAAVWR